MRAPSRFSRVPAWTAGVLALLAGLGTVGMGAVIVGCTDVQIGGVKSATLKYTDDARGAYAEAMKAYQDKGWEEARSLFSEVRKLFPYSRYATLAELRLADVDFEQEKYTDAVAGYREFIQNHHSDRDVDYARYRIAKALYRDIDETLLLPPAEERDQGTAQEAYKELTALYRENPRSRYAEDVHAMMDAVAGRLMRHELYVARFYLNKDAYPATIARIDHAMKLYPGSSLEPEALVLKGETLLRMNKRDEAREVFRKVVDEHGGPFAQAAKGYLRELDARAGTAKGP